MGFSPKSWLRYRVVLYALVVVGVFLYRNHIDWRRLVPEGRDRQGSPSTLVLAGRDLAPGLFDVLGDHYGSDYPDLAISTLAGGTNQALEDLINRRADAAFLSRPPTRAEQELFRQADGDTAIVVPVGVGAIVVLAGAGSPPGSRPPGEPAAMTVEQLGRLMAGDMQGRCDRFYAADPNLGFWAAAARLAGRDPAPVDTGTVVYLADDGQVVLAVGNDPRAMGMIASFDLPASPRRNLTAPGDSAAGPVIVAMADSSSAREVAPAYDTVAAGAYPLHLSLFVACRAGGDIQGGKFVTHLASGRGQRQIERAGCIPAKKVPHEVLLTNRPLGE